MFLILTQEAKSQVDEGKVKKEVQILRLNRIKVKSGEIRIKDRNKNKGSLGSMWKSMHFIIRTWID